MAVYINAHFLKIIYFRDSLFPNWRQFKFTLLNQHSPLSLTGRINERALVITRIQRSETSSRFVGRSYDQLEIAAGEGESGSRVGGSGGRGSIRSWCVVRLFTNFITSLIKALLLILNLLSMKSNYEF